METSKPLVQMFGGAARGPAKARKAIAKLALVLLGLTAVGRYKGPKTTIALLAAYIIYNIRATKPVVAPPGAPKPAFLVGHANQIKELQKCNVSYFLKHSRATNFKSYELTLPMGKRIVLLHEEEDRKYVLHDNWLNYQKNAPDVGFDLTFEEVLGRGIFATDGAEWKRARKIASHIFSKTALRAQMEEVFTKQGRVLTRILREKAETGEVFNLQDLAGCFAFDASCEVLFGETPGALASFSSGVKPPFLVAFDACQPTLMMRFRKPLVMWQLEKYFDVGAEGVLKGHCKVMREYVDKMVEKRTSEIVNGKAKGGNNDLLSLFIKHGRETGDSEVLRPESLRDVVLNFTVAGRDSTATSVINFFKLLSTNKGAEEKLRAELTEKVGKGENPTVNALGECKYADACFNEVIRYFPPIGHDARFVISDDVLPSGIKVYAGNNIAIPNYSIGHNPKYWGEDCDEFRPERWFERKDQARNATSEMSTIVNEQYRLPAFWAGPRLCLGKDMARFEAKVVAHLVLVEESLHIEAQPHEDKFMNGAVMYYQKGVPCIAKKIA